MVSQSPCHTSFVDGASRWNQNLSSITWVIYTLSHTLLYSGSIFVGPTTNKQVEYDALIGLLVDSIHYHIYHLCVHLNSHPLIAQLNNFYIVYDPLLFFHILCT